VCVFCAAFAQLMRGEFNPVVQYGRAAFVVDVRVPENKGGPNAGKEFTFTYSGGEVLERVGHSYDKTEQAIRALQWVEGLLVGMQGHDEWVLREVLIPELIEELEGVLESMRPESKLKLELRVAMDGGVVVYDTAIGERGVKEVLKWSAEPLVSVGSSFVRRGLCRQEAECVLRAAQTVLGDVATADLWGVEGLHIPRGFDERILRAMLTRLLSSLVSLSN
jgi:hypothetical protein